MAFDLDNEELKATRRDKGLDDGLYEDNMSEADKMLHEIGYMKEYEDDCEEIWNYEERFCIRFNKICKSVDFKRKSKMQFFGLKYHRISIDMQELQAINKKCEELNWI